MKVFRCMFTLVMFCGLTGLAKADPVDFHMNVLDPDSFPTFPITSTPYGPIGFVPCIPGELPAGATADGCFAGKNSTGVDWTGLDLVFSNSGSAIGQSVDCNTQADPGHIFDSGECSLIDNQFVLGFDGGTIKVDQLFFIIETGADPLSFPPGTLTYTASTVPEPSSILLLSTGMLMVGFLFARRGQGVSSRLRHF